MTANGTQVAAIVAEMYDFHEASDGVHAATHRVVDPTSVRCVVSCVMREEKETYHGVVESSNAVPIFPRRLHHRCSHNKQRSFTHADESNFSLRFFLTPDRQHSLLNPKPLHRPILMDEFSFACHVFTL